MKLFRVSFGKDGQFLGSNFVLAESMEQVESTFKDNVTSISVEAEEGVEGYNRLIVLKKEEKKEEHNPSGDYLGTSIY